MLLIADVHAGKASHFRNNGIPLSTDYLLNDLHTIQTLQQRLNATKICFLGDLYHTLSNEENLLTDQFLNDLESEIELVIGNHDRHSIRHSTIKCKEAYELDGGYFRMKKDYNDYQTKSSTGIGGSYNKNNKKP